MRKQALNLIVAVFLALGLSISFQSLLAAWTPPGANPPTNNLTPPVYNESGTPATTISLTLPVGTTRNISLGGSNANIVLGDNWLSGDGGDEGVFVDGDGRVGIGTSALGSRLDIVEAGVNASALRLLDGTGGWVNVFPNLSAGGWSGLSKVGDMGLIFSDGSIDTGNLVIAPWATGAAKAGLYLTNTGNLGVGINNPRAKLSVGFNDSDALNIYSPAGNTLAIQTTLDDQPIGVYGGDGENRLILQPTVGNVGIGKNNPVAKLDVLGGVKTSRLGYYGTYNSLEVQGIWSMAQNYLIDTANNNFGNQYGLAYAHTNASSVGTEQGPVAGFGHQILFTGNGNRQAAISLTNGNALFDGKITMGTQTAASDADTVVATKKYVDDKAKTISCTWNGWYYTDAGNCCPNWWSCSACGDHTTDFRCVGGIITEARGICVQCIPFTVYIGGLY